MDQGRVIILNCFGRGGSNIVWNMIGSSPDVIMTDQEWHQAVFGSAHRFRKLATRSFWNLGISSVGPLQRRAHRALLEMRSPEDLEAKRSATSIVTKVMDYHIAFNSMIARGFHSADYVVLIRHPFGQCESLMRSGHDLRDACRWYADIAGDMAETLGKRNGIVIRFEDLLTQPVEACDRLYSCLKISWRTDGRFRLKKKQFGKKRLGDGNFSQNRFEWIGADNASQHIDATVVRSGVGRLAPAAREEIWRRTKVAARNLGYQEDALDGCEPLHTLTGQLGSTGQW